MYTRSSAGRAPRTEGGSISYAIGGLALLLLPLVAAIWTILRKAGEPGWASLIPLYNVAVLLRVSGRSPWWLIVVVLVCPLGWVILCVDLAASFGKGTGFSAGLALLPVVFFPILGFGPARYEGPAAKRA